MIGKQKGSNRRKTDVEWGQIEGEKKEKEDFLC